ncbi:MAG: DMT family transporter [Ruminococcus sp.]|nr:DMT family transporter [Ruminococcus sp.]
MTIPKRYKGIIYICISALCFALMAVFVRLAGDLPTFQKTFFRNFVALFFAAGVLIKKRIPLRLGEKKLMFPLLVRALAGTLGMIGNFYAIDRMVLSDASMLNKMSPFFAIVFSYIFLKEKLTVFQITAVIAAFGGSLLIIKPSFQNVDMLPALAGFLGGMGAGLAYTCVHYLGQHGVKGPIIVAFFSAFSCLFCLPFLITHYEPMSGVQLLCLLGAGASAAGGQFSITAAYTHAPAREISIYDYSQLIFSTSLGFFLFGDVPDGWSFLGYAVIVTMAVLNFIYNNRKHGASGEGH